MYVASRTERFNIFLNIVIGLAILFGGLIIGGLIIKYYHLPQIDYSIPGPIAVIMLFVAGIIYRAQRKRTMPKEDR